jgi:nicotinate-nucleotide adenylyltransferase
LKPLKRPPTRVRRARRLTVAPPRGPKVGLFGGSFNPAHEGHLHVSRQAINRLGLDELWWLVSPQNPLKPVRGMAPFEQRLEQARRMARHPKIRVSDCERRYKSAYSADTIRRLRRDYPRHRFVWIMGADNLADFARWRRWREIFEALPIAILDRESYSQSASASKPLQRFRRWRLAERSARVFASHRPPAWMFFRGRLHPASASAIRKDARRKTGERGDESDSKTP